MNDAIKLGITAGAMGALAGLGMQSHADQMVQTIGQGWMLGGVASTALVGGFAALSSKWNSFKQERAMKRTMEHLEMAVSNSTQTDGLTLTSFVNVARTASQFFEDARDSKKEAITVRLQMLGMAIADKMPHMEQADAAANVVHNTMGYARFKLGQSLAQDAPVRKSGIDIDLSSSTPSMGQ